MKRIDFPICDIRPGDHFEVCRSQRTGYFLIYHYRRHHGASYDDVDQVASFSTQGEATKCRNFYRRQEERIRAESELDNRLPVWMTAQVVTA